MKGRFDATDIGWLLELVAVVDCSACSTAANRSRRGIAGQARPKSCLCFRRGQAFMVRGVALPLRVQASTTGEPSA